MVKLLQRLDDEKIDWKPDRTAPVRVATEQAGARFARLVLDFIGGAVELEPVRVLEVVAADRPDAIRAEELVRVQHPLEQALHPMSAHKRQQAPFTQAWFLPTRHK